MARENKERVVAFRLPIAEGKELDKRVEDKVVGVKSGNQVARKVVRDFLRGRLVYISPADRSVDEDVAVAGISN